jgi:hypothetical protein
MKIFLSYASEDKDAAERVYLSLEKVHHQVFFDRADLSTGGDFDSRIRKAIGESELFIFLISPDSVASPSYALTELKFAREKWRSPVGRVLPVMLRATSYDSIPNYIKTITVLEPEGNVAAEVAGRVASWRPGGRGRVSKPVNAKAIALILILILIFASGLSIFAIRQSTSLNGGKSTDQTLEGTSQGTAADPEGIAVNQLWQYQPPPEPLIRPYDGMVRGAHIISIDIPLRIVNKSNQIMYVERIMVQWNCLGNFSAFDKYTEIVSNYQAATTENSQSNQPLGELLKKYEGCTLNGYPSIGVRYKDEVELQNDLSREKKKTEYIYFPLKLTPHEEVITRFIFDLNVVAKDREILHFPVQNKEQEAIFLKLLPIFFGGASLQDVTHPVLLIFETNKGVFEIQDVFQTGFVGTVISVPKELIKPEVRDKISKPQR